MNWEALGAIGEIVGAVAVIATLGYLAVQIRQNTQSLRAGAFQQYRERQDELTRALMEPSMASVYRRGLDCPEQLTEEERSRFEAMMILAFNSQENFFLLREMGLINDRLWAEGRTAYHRFLLKHDEPNRWWERSQRMFSGSFVDYVESFRTRDTSVQGDKPDRP
jgi:hypothetical protein